MAIRITGGNFRGRFIPSPDTSKTRPTASRTREAIFNIIPSVENFKVLDLFAGTGIMGIEALSRGASNVTAVEKSKSQARLIREAYKSLQLESVVNLLETDALSLSLESRFDLIYADPPFKDMDYPDLRKFIGLLNPNGYAVFEAPTKNLPAWAKQDELENRVRIRRYGESSLLIYKGE
ncbi:MAG: 16S rRNA (guanine(966)-N(2))-methyltransferase RsmD [Fibrobacter sp.]|nr:16S rRNA (guanine(966)-N(2))-methyltransferase RsmD [Fibrobacter sp.]